MEELFYNHFDNNTYSFHFNNHHSAVITNLPILVYEKDNYQLLVNGHQQSINRSDTATLTTQIKSGSNNQIKN